MSDVFSALDPLFWTIAFAALALLLAAAGFAIFSILSRLLSARRARFREAREALWGREIIAVLAGDDSPAAVTRRVARGEEFYFINFLIRYARRLRGQERRELERLAAPFLPLVAARRNHREPERRSWAIYTLGFLGLERYADSVRTALTDRYPFVAVTAAFSLLGRRRAADARIVLEFLERFRGWNVWFLSYLFSRLGPTIAPDLRKIFEDDWRISWTRLVAARTLLDMKDPDAADSAARVLAHAADPSVAAIGLQILSELGRPSHRAAVLAGCASSHMIVRARAMTALGRLGTLEDLPVFERGFREDPSVWVAYRAAEGMKAVGAMGRLREIGASPHPRAALARQVVEAP